MLPIASVLVDFDGTACSHDVAEHLLIEFADPSWEDYDEAESRGEIGTRQCIVAQAAMLEASDADLMDFATGHCAVDPTFPPFVRWLDGQGVGTTIVSDGFGFYIPPLLEASGLTGVPVVTNSWTGGDERVAFGNGHPVCVGCGTCKMNAVLDAGGLGPVAFVGDGASDRYGALYADVVFAKDGLVDICGRDGVPFLPWETFDDVRAALESLEALPGPVGGERCPRVAAAVTIELPAGFTARPATKEDAEAVTAVVAASETRHQGFANIDVDDVVADYAGTTDLARDSLVVLEGDRIVAEMLVDNARDASGSVHPDFEGRGIGTAILRWSEGVARLQGGTEVGGTIPDGNEAGRRLFLANGYEPYWESWILEIRCDEEPDPPTLPEGMAIRAFEPGEEETVHRVIEDAFSEWDSRPPHPFEEWRAWALGRNRFEPWMLPVLTDADQIVGAAFLIDYPGDTGWVQQLAVRADHRGQGLGRALLQHAFGEFHRRGQATTGLSTDSRTGARSLYEHVGMRVKSSYTHYGKKL